MWASISVLALGHSEVKNDPNRLLCVDSVLCPGSHWGRNCHLAGDSILFLFQLSGIRGPSVTAFSWDQPVPILSGDHFPVPCAQIMLYLSVCSVASLRNAKPLNVICGGGSLTAGPAQLHHVLYCLD